MMNDHPSEISKLITGNPRKSAQGGITGLGGQNEQKLKIKTRPWAYFQGGGRIFRGMGAILVRHLPSIDTFAQWVAWPVMIMLLCSFNITTVFAISNLSLIELVSNRANYKDSDVSSKSVNQPWYEYNANIYIVTSPPEGVARYCFHPVCLSVCVCVSVYLCVRPIFWYFIYRLLEEISI